MNKIFRLFKITLIIIPNYRFNIFEISIYYFKINEETFNVYNHLNSVFSDIKTVKVFELKCYSTIIIFTTITYLIIAWINYITIQFNSWSRIEFFSYSNLYTICLMILDEYIIINEYILFRSSNCSINGLFNL